MWHMAAIAAIALATVYWYSNSDVDRRHPDFRNPDFLNTSNNHDEQKVSHDTRASAENEVCCISSFHVWLLQNLTSERSANSIHN